MLEVGRVSVKFQHWQDVPPIHRFILKPHASWIERQLAYDFLEENNQRWNTIALSNFEVVYDEIISSCADCLVSPRAIYDTIKRKRYIPGDEINPNSGALAAQYLRSILKAYAIPNLEMVSDRERALEEIPILPAYWDGKPHANERLAYVDISSCYWSILRWLTLDTTINGATVSPGKIHFLEPYVIAQSKDLRNAIYGLTRSPSSTKHYRFGQISGEERRPQPFWNPYLSICTVSTTNSVAQDCMSNGFKIYQWLTDAAILPEREADKLVEFLAERWKLRARIVDSGKGRLQGYGLYAFGKLATIEGKTTDPVDTIDRSLDSEFWRMTRLFFADRRPPLLLPGWPRSKWSLEAEKTYSEPIEIRFEKGRLY